MQPASGGFVGYRRRATSATANVFGLRCPCARLDGEDAPRLLVFLHCEHCAELRTVAHSVTPNV
jgi:hypothetical protein